MLINISPDETKSQIPTKPDIFVNLIFFGNNFKIFFIYLINELKNLIYLYCLLCYHVKTINICLFN